MQMARHGATATGGVNRQALSTAEFDARRELIGWGRELGLAPYTDPIGNLFLRLRGAEEGAAPVMTGSHLDSQPTGGKFDGVYGVLAGLEAVQAIVESGTKLRRPVDIVAWMNEEGSRFVPGMMGSAAFSGVASLDDLLPVRDAEGASVADGIAAARAAFPDVPQRALGQPVAAYIEAHIEQGPVLELERVIIGVVTGIQGKRTFRVSVKGEEGHAGTLPHGRRKDALLAATAMIQALSAAMHDPDDVVKFTVGRLEVLPNAPSVIAGAATFSIDLRHPDSNVLQRLGDQVAGICSSHAGPCTVSTVELTTAMSLDFPAGIRALIRTCAQRLGISTMDLHSAAGHDARYLHAICPSGMLFVPCKGGISHNEAESATAEDLAAGARVLTEVLVELAESATSV
ncbi:MAG: hydantoinase/carbamoylase family amidase [Pseudomonadota bacterium]|nr:hydantoinase/carbamoylase family amidase [Pseudomonadota bacterium]